MMNSNANQMVALLTGLIFLKHQKTTSLTLNYSCFLSNSEREGIGSNLMTDTTDTAALREECAQWVKEAIGEAVDTHMALNGDGNDYMSWDMSVIWLAWLHLSGK